MEGRDRGSEIIIMGMYVEGYRGKSIPKKSGDRL